MRFRKISPENGESGGLIDAGLAIIFFAMVIIPFMAIYLTEGGTYR